jgi:tRNA pseudouridine38-40 synthase
MRKIALALEYDGTAFCGWQTQPDGCSVQDALEQALAQIAGQPIATVCAGRTDAGVHALNQVVHFETSAERPESAWVRGVNALLPAGAAVLWAKPVSNEFHARFSALSRRYVYFLLNRAQRPALLSARVGWFHLPLDETAMREAAQCLLGEHDFSAFRAAECQARSPVRTVSALAIERRGELLRFDLQANAFLQHMARNIIGSLVFVGAGRESARWLGEVLESRDRSRAAPTFSASGLYLAQVEYAPEWQLPGAQGSDALEAVLAAVH